MNSSRYFSGARRTCNVLLVGLGLIALVGCSSQPERPKPAELAPSIPLLGVRQAWSAAVGAVDFPLQPVVTSNGVVVASADGTVAELDIASGRDKWRTNIGKRISAGVGSDGKLSAVVTRDNSLVVVSLGKELWRQSLQSQVYSAPMVAGNRVFVLTADRAVIAFDGLSGTKLWTQQRPGDALVLDQAGVLTAVGDTLVVGLAGRLVGLNPLSGTVRWEAPIATPRGINEIERLVDIVSGHSRVGDTVCARAYFAAVGCADARNGRLTWTKPATGFTGVDGDDRAVFGVESNGKVVAWSATAGDPLWTSDRLLYRNLTAPLLVGRSVAIGDSLGFVHLLSREDGTPVNRLVTDGSAIVGKPIVADQTLIVVSRSGGVFAFVPQ